VSGLTFREIFGRAPQVSAHAPGRVNLIGEHTDYNDGLVLPTTIPQRTDVEIAPSGDDRVQAWSANVSTNGMPASYRLGHEQARHAWVDFAQGATAALREAGLGLGGFDLRVESTIPLGSGLSSSAALLVAVLRGLREAFAIDLDDTALARLAHRAENSLVGAPVGIMDQMVCSLGRAGHALFLDTRSMRVEHIPLPAAADLVVINSNVHHAHAGGEYGTRRRECEEAAARLGVPALRDIAWTSADRERLESLPTLLARRARHVVSENARVERMVDALRGEDVETAGALLAAGHASLRDDFEVSTPEIDLLVDIAAGQADVFGARLTGGGFGGSIVALARAGTGRSVAEAVAADYESRTGCQATVLLPITAPASGT
jgi:galactokinase